MNAELAAVVAGRFSLSSLSLECDFVSCKIGGLNAGEASGAVQPIEEDR